VTFEAIEAQGTEALLEQLRDETDGGRTYQPLPARKGRKDNRRMEAKSASFSIPAIRDRVVQGALKLILEPVFEADFPTGIVWISAQSGKHMTRSKRVAEANCPTEDARPSTLTCEGLL